MSSMLAIAARDGIVGGETPEEAVKGCTSMSYVAGADTVSSKLLISNPTPFPSIVVLT
jgi:hypothetical protein